MIPVQVLVVDSFASMIFFRNRFLIMSKKSACKNKNVSSVFILHKTDYLCGTAEALTQETVIWTQYYIG